MLFCSEDFIFIFLPIFLILYYFCPKKRKNQLLFLGSLWFYFTGEKNWFLLMLFSLVFHYIGVSKMQRCQGKWRKCWLAGMLCYDVITLVFFKYIGMIAPQWKVTLPLGISFYTFQIMAYAIDMYRSPEEEEADFVSLGTYLCMFPQLIAGPIVLFGDVKQRLKERRLSFESLEEGFMIFIIGLSYKMLIANILGSLWHEIQVVGIESISNVMAWMGALAYSLQLYFDFNGYSLMAIGLGLMLGFELPRNFRQPYLATSITDFWHRWHITLSGWFREYLYIPLGGSRKGVIRTIINLFLVWALTGMWHGAGWNFLIWGIYYFVFLLLEKFVLKKFCEKYQGLSRVYTLLVVLVGWVIFSLNDLQSIGVYLQKMFYWTQDWNVHLDIAIDAMVRYGIFFVVAILCATEFVEKAYQKYKKRFFFKALLFVLFWICVYRIEIGASNPFLYFRF